MLNGHVVTCVLNTHAYIHRLVLLSASVRKFLIVVVMINVTEVPRIWGDTMPRIRESFASLLPRHRKHPRMEEPEDGVLYYEMLSLDKTEIAHRNSLQLRLPAQEQAT